MWRAGWSVGPRYITVMLPFLLPLVAVALQHLKARWWLFGLAAGTVLVGIAIYAISSATFSPIPLIEVSASMIAVPASLATRSVFE